jgi:hypothetical protein
MPMLKKNKYTNKITIAYLHDCKRPPIVTYPIDAVSTFSGEKKGVLPYKLSTFKYKTSLYSFYAVYSVHCDGVRNFTKTPRRNYLKLMQ